VRTLYCILGYLLSPAYFAALAWRGLRERGYWRGWGARLGFGPRIAPGGVWVHAASVGETQAAAPLLVALRRCYPTLALLMTTATPAGLERARALLGAHGVQLRHVPLDLPGAVRRFLARTQPRLAIMLETELWPNLYHGCRARDVPLVLLSARLSERSARRYARIGRLWRDTLASVAWVGAQSAADAARFARLGAPVARTCVLGNLKFDLQVPAATEARGVALRQRHAAGRALWVAGSTHPGEEAVLLEAHRRLRLRHPGSVLALAPRHPQRFAEVAAALERAAVPFVRRSRNQPGAADIEVLLLDTLGELLDWYAAADVAFVGGSLVPVGGHNLLEPAALGRAILCGPYVFNNAEIARWLLERGALEQVPDAATLAERLASLLEDAPERAHRGASGRALVEENRGAVERALGLIEPYLTPPGSSVNAAAAPELRAN